MSILGAAGVSAAANMAGSYMQAREQKKANEANIAMSKKQMRFQEQMSSTAHQREVADLKAAGLNPLLSAGGGGSSSPAGAMTTVAPEKNLMGSLAESLKEGVNSGMGAVRMKQDLKNAEANEVLTKTSAATAKAQRDLNVTNAAKAKTEAERVALENSVLKSKMPSIAKRAEADLKKATYDSEWAGHDALQGRLSGWAGFANDAVSTFFGGKLKGLFGGGTQKQNGYSVESYNGQGEHVGTKSYRRH